MTKRSLLGLAARAVPRTARSWDAMLLLFTGVLFAITWPTMFVTHDISRSLAPAVAAAGLMPLVLTRAQPFAGWAVSAAVAVIVGVGLEPAPDYDFPWHVTHFLVLLALLFTVALTAPAREVATAWLATAAIFLLLLPWDVKAGWIFGVTMATVVALLLRWLVLSRRQLARQEALSELERARRAVLEERGRIARDLHDVVAHSMSMVVVQAQSAPRRLGGVSPEVEREFRSIGEQARTALNEVRGMLGVLRSDGQLAENLPQPGLDQVDPLLREAREAGVALTWSVVGDPDGCSEASAMVVVRVLQESLANASRHAPGTDVRVDLEYVDDAVLVRVRNSPDPAGARPAQADLNGTGLTGMRARVNALGGTVTAGPAADGSFEVRATVPKVATGGSGAASKT